MIHASLFRIWFGRFANLSRGKRVVALLAGALIIFIAKTPALAAEEKGGANRIIQYRGPLPLLGKDSWGHEVELKFELYRSPTGGTPFWSESRRVQVSADGMARVDLGQVERLPDEAFKTPFRFLSIWHDKTEFVPRKQVVSVVYVASTDESGVSKDRYAEQGLAIAAGAVGQTPGGEKPLDALIRCGDFSMETHSRPPATWLEAMEMADRMGAQMPNFDEWYAAYDGQESKSFSGMVGHYEWVIPWVYEPAIHARMHELYRGKTVACYYNELSPLNHYSFRLVTRHPDSK